MPPYIKPHLNQILQSQKWWCTPLISALGRQRQAGDRHRQISVFEASLIIEQFQESQDYPETPCLKQPKKNQTKPNSKTKTNNNDKNPNRSLQKQGWNDPLAV